MNEFQTFDLAELDTRTAHGLLLGSVSPRPIALVSTVDAQGRPNLAPFSYFNVFSTRPPLCIFSPNRRGTDGSTKHTHDNVLAVPQVVIHLVDYASVHATSLASCDFAEGVDEFAKAGFTAVPSSKVAPPRALECPVALECEVREVVSLGTQGGAGNLVMCEVVQMHIAKKVLNEKGLPDPALLDLVGRCGGNTYVRASGEALFEIRKPLGEIGMGFDALPADIRKSAVLTGNQLAQLAGADGIPDETQVNEHKLVELADIFIELEGQGAALEEALHRRAAGQIDAGQVAEAWMTLRSFNHG
jgi:flavin reductase (DIM6/NTAB) family NADH-FMN oxidoreductase RutF